MFNIGIHIKMAIQDQRKIVLDQAQELKKVVLELKNRCNSLDDEKEKFYAEKQEIGNKIKALIEGIKSSKSKRDTFTQMVKVKKTVRDDLNKNLKEKIAQLSQLELQKKDVLSKQKDTKEEFKGDPFFIKKKIDALDYQIETSAISFNKEQELMKQIKKLKQEYKNMSVAMEINKKINELRREVTELKQEANLSHHVVSSTAKESQKKHEELVGSSKEIDELRKLENEAFAKFSELKKKYIEASNDLRDKSKQLKELYAQLDMQKEAAKKDKESHQQVTLEEKRKQVDEKIKKGKKLTTEDIIAFQGR